MGIEQDLARYTACFTGHRAIRQTDIPTMDKQLNEIIGICIENGICWFMCGGALGFDTLAAQKVLELRDGKYPYIRLCLALPCLNQDARWHQADRIIYESIKSRADKVIYTSERNYFDGCMAIRNRFMVDSSYIVVYYQYKTWGGTAQTINFAKEHKKLRLNVITRNFDA